MNERDGSVIDRTFELTRLTFSRSKVAVMAKGWLAMVFKALDRSDRKRGALRAGGEMGDRIRACDWASTPLGAIDGWPDALYYAVQQMLLSPHPMFIWWGSDLLQFYNDACAQTMGPERHPSALGDRGRDCWAEIWPIIGPQIDFVLSGGGSTWDEERLVPVTRNGAREDVWWTYSYSPIDDRGVVGGVLAICTDVTQEHLTKLALEEAASRHASDAERIRNLFRQAPGFVAVLRGPDHVFEFTNAAYDELVGHRAVVGKSVREILPEVVGQGYIELLDAVYGSGEAHVGVSQPLHLLRSPDGEAQEVYVDFVYQPMFDAHHVVTGVFVEGFEVTARMRAEEQQRLVAREMHHRLKNGLTVIQSLVALTGRSASTVAEYRETLSARIQALAATQDLFIRSDGGDVEVAELLRAELAPFLDAENRAELRCPPILASSQSASGISLIVHELVTNAVKYGAFSTDDGRLTVQCTASRGGLIMSWCETASCVSAVRKPGFGMTLIERVAQGLGGSAVLDFRPAGLMATITLELEQRAP